jgi:ABC-type nitrate/sulfonate/bicarbonate transport system permease component
MTSASGNMLEARRLMGALPIVVLLICWEMFARFQVFNPAIIPPISAIAQELAVLLSSGELARHFSDTFGRLFLAYAVAAAIGVGLGLPMGYFRPVYLLFEPLIESLRPIPNSALIPVTMLFFGPTDTMVFFSIAWACFFPILINTIDGVRNIDPVLINTARTFRIGGLDLFRKFIVPAAAPLIWTGLRVALALALIVGVSAEMIVGQNGVGYFMVYAAQRFSAEMMFSTVFAVAVVGYLLNKGFLMVDSRVLAWHRKMTSKEAL